MHNAQLGRAFAATALLAFAAAACAYAACLAGGLLPERAGAWLSLAATSLVAGGVGASLLERLVMAPARRLAGEMAALLGRAGDAERELAERSEQQRRLRHDLRGALSPVLLVADRLTAHADPAVKRSGDIMVRTVERATNLLEERDGRATPPSGS